MQVGYQLLRYQPSVASALTWNLQFKIGVFSMHKSTDLLKKYLGHIIFMWIRKGEHCSAIKPKQCFHNNFSRTITQGIKKFNYSKTTLDEPKKIKAILIVQDLRKIRRLALREKNKSCNITLKSKMLISSRFT